MKITSGILRTAYRATAFFTFAAVAIKAQAPLAQQNSPKETLERFCKMDAEGKQLGPEGQKEVADVLYDKKPWAEHAEITVVKDFVVRAPEIRGDTAEVVVNYNVWGQLDSSLRFARLEGPLVNRPILVTEYISIVRSDKHRELGSDGRWQEVKGLLEWRIKTVPSAPHISVETAIRYVRGMGYKSRDPMVRRNADNTFTSLAALLRVPVGLPAQPQQQTPMAVLSQFVTLETDGKGLTADGWKELDAFHVQPRPWQHEKIHIAKDFVVSNAALSGGKAELYVVYIGLGELDSSLRFTSGVPGGDKVQEGYHLVQSNRSSATSDDGSGKDVTGPSRWKIEDSPAEQWISVSTAIRYVKEMRDKTTDPAIKQNADQTLAKLKTLH